MEIKIRYADKEIDKLEKITQGDLIDLRCAEDVDMKQGELRLISLGIAMQLPENYEAHIYPRSSTAKKFGIIVANSVGIVDNSYNSDTDVWKLNAYAIRDTHIDKNTRIAQFRIVENQPEIEFVEVESLGNEARGGFGSTGTN